MNTFPPRQEELRLSLSEIAPQPGSFAKRLARVLPALAVICFSAAAQPAAAQSIAPTAGAPAPFIEYRAGGAGVRTNGHLLGPNFNFGTVAAEATGRRAVLLAGRGRYVSFTLTAPANGMTLHYAIPDAPAGGGLTEPLSLYINDRFVTSLRLTSKYSWLYGPYSFRKQPALGMPGFNPPHDFYNDARYLFPALLPAGTVVKLQVDAGDDAPWYAINTADFEPVPPPLAAPSQAIDVTAWPYQADNSGVRDSTAAIQAAIYAGENSGQTVFLPAGVYSIHGPLAVDRVSIEGAGEWYTVLTGVSVEFAGHISPPSTDVHISHLALFGNVGVRRNQDGTVNGFDGGFSDSSISHVWIQNEKCGLWIVGPSTHLVLSRLRILDLKADGINFDAAYGGVTHSSVQDSFLRNTQDDGIALWSLHAADSDDAIMQNTVDSPGLANNVAVYGGGSGVVISGNLLQDTVTRGGGIHVGQRFGAVPMSGVLTISHNRLNRDGQFDPGFFFGIGAIWFWPQQGGLDSGIQLSDNLVQNSPESAIQFLGSGGIEHLSITDTVIAKAGTFAFAQQGAGWAYIAGAAASGLGAAGVFNRGCDSGFMLADGGGNTGWNSTTCAYPAAAPLWIYPDVLTFQHAALGQPSPPLRIAVINKQYKIARLGTIAAGFGFAVTPDPAYPCGRYLAPARFGGGPQSGWCLVDVTFTPYAPGITAGALRIPSDSPGSPASVLLVGSSGDDNTLNLPPELTPSGLAFGEVGTGHQSAPQTVVLTNPAGAAPLAIASIAASSGYAQTNTCDHALAGGESCTISVTFTPAGGGRQAGTLAIAFDNAAYPLTAPLSGTGVLPLRPQLCAAQFTAADERLRQIPAPRLPAFAQCPGLMPK